LTGLAAATGSGESQERALLLAQAMRLLPAKCVELLEEKYLESRTVRQMAEKRAQTEKAIESALSRARELLRTAFQRLQAKEEIGHDHSRL